MTMDELTKLVMDLFPNALLDQDGNGEIVIATGLTTTGTDELVSVED